MRGLAEQLKKLKVQNLKTSSGEAYCELLRREANRLKDCIQNRLDIYMSSYKPKMYVRTNAFQKSLMVDDIMNIYAVGKTLYIDIYFDDSGYHKSGDGIRTPWGKEWQGNGKRVNTAVLLNYGYTVKEAVWFRDYENFGYRKGGKFIENGIADFLSNNPYGIRVNTNASENMDYIVQ